MKQPTGEFKDPRERVQAIVLDHIDFFDALPEPSEVAMQMIDEDVAAGLYAGCSNELDLCASEYLAIAERIVR